MNDLEEVAALWQRYVEVENRGERPDKIHALGQFLDRMELADEGTRTTWATNFLTRKIEGSEELPLRTPLFQRLLFPLLKTQYTCGDARAARWLASLVQDLFRYRTGWEELGCPSEIDLWKEAYRRDPSTELVRERIVDITSTFIRYTLHELPDGVLYGRDGATLDECKLLLVELGEFRALLTPHETEHFSELLKLASFHYPAYVEYLSQTETQGYAVFLRAKGTA